MKKQAGMLFLLAFAFGIILGCITVFTIYIGAIKFLILMGQL